MFSRTTFVRLATLIGCIVLWGMVTCTPVVAQTGGGAIGALRSGLKDTADQANISTATQGLGLPQLIGRLIGVVLSFVAVAFFLLTLYGGIKWMFARGDEGAAKQSVDTITAAISGIIVVIGAYAITNFVLDSVGVKNTGVQSPASQTAPAAGAHTVPLDGACNTNSDCVLRAVCSSSKICVEACVDLNSSAYACRQRSECDATTIQTGLCTDPSNDCCQVRTGG